MKKILLAVTAALAITGCSQNEEYDASSNSVINFNSVISKSNRAAIIEQADFREFGVYGYRTSDDIGAETQLTDGFMDNLKVSSTDGTTWTQGEGTFYWPATGSVNFFATSPIQTWDISKIKGFPKFVYAVGAIDTQKDLLVAGKKQDKTSPTVNLAFKHVLTQVNFSIKGDTKDFKYDVTSIKIDGVNGEGTFTFDGTSNVGAWSGLGTPASYEYTTPFEVVVDDIATATPVGIDANTSMFMLLPQTLTASAKVYVTYSAMPKTGTGTLDETFRGTKSIALGADTEWEVNKKIRYTLNLTSDATGITLGAPTINPWDAAEAKPEVTPAPAK